MIDHWDGTRRKGICHHSPLLLTDEEIDELDIIEHGQGYILGAKPEESLDPCFLGP